VKVCEYGTPTCAVSGADAVTVMTGLATVIVTVAGAEVPAALVAV
jgi:hypothetical protein